MNVYWPIDALVRQTMVPDLKSFHSIRVNDQWRVVFRWQAGDAYDVQVLDYH